MRRITKGKEPRSLVKHRANDHCTYENYADKDGLRSALVREQRGLCCYCMARVAASGTGMKVEHWRCQSRYETLELSYSNLLAACPGGEGQPVALQHCDTRKGDADLKFNPANAAHRIERRIRFDLDGSIASTDPEFDKQVNDVLGLNLAFLKNRRKAILDAIMEWYRSEKARLRGPVPRRQIERERAKRAGTGNSHIAPMDPVAVWWLDQRLAKGAA
jgi:uncharacterized protein (TIGR02646 family)